MLRHHGSGVSQVCLLVSIRLDVFFDNLLLKIVIIQTVLLIHSMDIHFEPRLLRLLGLRLCRVFSRGDLEALTLLLIEVLQMFFSIIKLVGRVTEGVFIDVKVIEPILAFIINRLRIVDSKAAETPETTTSWLATGGTT